MRSDAWRLLAERLRSVGRRLSGARRDTRLENELRIARLRRRGVRIGEGCIIHTDSFSTEPYLVELGNHVGVAGGAVFVTHDGSVWLVRQSRPQVQHFGRIVVGDNCVIGQNSILLPHTTIGANSIIGAGSVVRGTIPEDSLVIGNPARVVGRASLALSWLVRSPDTFDSLHLSDDDRRRLLETHFEIRAE
jgi:acetyltransferase-like isoleucine patch superfamily enzyme